LRNHGAIRPAAGCPNQAAMGSIVARPNGSRADVTPLYKNSYERLLPLSRLGSKPCSITSCKQGKRY